MRVYLEDQRRYAATSDLHKERYAALVTGECTRRRGTRGINRE